MCMLIMIKIKFIYISGLQIIFTLDEVSFVQNLIFYIETAYRTPVGFFFMYTQLLIYNTVES